MDVAERIRAEGANLTAAERRVATVILESPQSIGFGTVADLAKSAQVGAASVVRLANKLGFDGYSDLQQHIQNELSAQLRPAAERIHDDTSASVAAHAEAELDNVRTTLAGISNSMLIALVTRIADRERPVLVLSGDASGGVCGQFVAQLAQLRSDVIPITGSPVSVARQIALAPVESTGLVVDLRRYEQWVLDAHAAMADRGIWSAALTDSLLSPLAQRADATFLLSAAAVGPFDSHVGTLALLNLIANHVAAELRTTAAGRLAAIERAWTASGALADGS